MASILSQAAVSNSETERRAQELLYAWYQLYFTGTPVTLAGDTVTLPKLAKTDYVFQQGPLRQPSATPQIQTVFIDLKPTYDRAGEANLVRAEVMASVTVSCAYPSSGDQKADHQARLVADALRRMFESERHAIAQKGIRHARVLRGPKPISTPLAATRLLMVRLELQFEAPV